MILYFLLNCFIVVSPDQLQDEYPRIGLKYSIDGGEKKWFSNEEHGSNSKYIDKNAPFRITIYMVHKFCYDDEIIYDANFTTEKECQSIYLLPEHYLKKCDNGYSIEIHNDIKDMYDVNIVKPNKEVYELLRRVPSIFRYGHYEKFSLDIYLAWSRNTSHPYYLETIVVNETNMVRKYVDSDVPVQAYPHDICLLNDLPYFYKIGYINKKNETIVFNKVDNYSFVELDQFIFDVKIFSSPSCNYSRGLSMLNVTAEQNSTCYTITKKDLPDECAYDGYPDDTPKYLPDTSNNSKIPYYFLFIGECDHYDELIQKCTNKSVTYPFCNFVLNAVGNRCTNIDEYNLKNLPIAINKLFIITSESIYDPRFFDLLHPTIVHIKGIDMKDPEIYFQNYDKDQEKRLNMSIPLDCKGKVSYLTAENFDIEIPYEQPLTIESVYLKNSDISGRFHTKYITLDEKSVVNYYEFNVFKQFTYAIGKKKDRRQYRIDYDQFFTYVRSKNYEEEYYKGEGTLQLANYDQTERYGLNFVGHFVELNVMESKYHNHFHPINISILPMDDELPSSDNPILLNDEPKYKVNIITTGNWSSIENNDTVYFTAYHDLIEVDANLNSYTTLQKVNPYRYQPVTWAPVSYQPLDSIDKSLISYIIISDYGDLAQCNKVLEKMLECRWLDCKEKNDMIDYIIDAKCVIQNTLDESLKNIKENIDKLYIVNNINITKIDFNQLPHQVVVNLTSVQSLFDSSENNSIHNDQIKRNVIIKGGISNKVSYLTISDSLITILENDLNIDSLRLYNSAITNASKNIKSYNLIVDLGSHANLFSYDKYIDVKQYTFILDDENAHYKILFDSDKLKILIKGSNDTEYESIDQQLGYVFYNNFDIFGLITFSHNIDFGVLDPNANIKNVNITVYNDKFDKNSINYAPIEESKYKLILNVSDEFPSDKTINVTFTAFHDLIELNYSKPYINLIQKDVFKFNPHPLIIPDPTNTPTISSFISTTTMQPQVPSKTPVPEIIEELYDPNSMNDINDVNQFNSDLDETFEKLDKNEIEGNHIVKVNAKSFPFDRELKSNQYLKPAPNSKIDYIRGYLNVVFPDEGDITISLDENENVNLSLKGNGNVNFESNKNEIIIQNKTVINGTLSIKVSENINSVLIDSVDVSKMSSIECKSTNDSYISLFLNNLNADENSKTKLNSIVIKDTLTIEQTAHLEFHNVEVKDSKIVYNIHDFEQLDTILGGEFGNPPNSFNINLHNNPNHIDKLNVMSGKFEENICELWADNMNVNTEFYSAKCSKENARSLEYSSKTLYIDFNQNKDPANPSKNKGLPPGGIAGIVIAVVVVIVIIVVVIFFIKKKRNNNKSNESIDEGDEKINDEI